jgi:hypothetical protein
MLTEVDAESEQRWFREALAPPATPWVHHVDELLPPGFESYFRLFHPFVPWSSAHSTPSMTVAPAHTRSWRSLADRAGVTFHAELSGRSLEPVLPVVDGARPYGVDEGRIEPAIAAALLETLSANALGEPIYFAFSHPACFLVLAGPLVLRGQIEDFNRAQELASGAPGPTYIWPEDRRWLVATDADLPSTYLGAGIVAAAALEGTDELELLPVTLHTRIDRGSDQLNGTGYAEDYVRDARP